MSILFQNAAAAVAFILVLEVGIWMHICLGLSMEFDEMSFTDAMRNAPYRLFWFPKALSTLAFFTLFLLSAHSFQRGKGSMALATTTFVLLGVHAILCSLQGVRAFRAYVAQSRSNPTA